MTTDPIAERVARLTPGQLDCLRLVDQHLSSKEIATELGISPHTVDQRIRQSLHILGVERRAQAARIVAQCWGRDQCLNTGQRPASFRPSVPLPFATGSRRRNELGVGQRLFWIVTIAIGAAFSAGIYLAGLESLARLLKS